MKQKSPDKGAKSVGMGGVRRKYLHTKNNCGFETGRIIKMKRGKFEWKLTVPDDGSLPEGGILPVLIEWSDELNPSHALVKSGVFLEKILIKHPDKERIDGILRRLNIQAEITVEIGPKNFCFHLRSEKGEGSFGVKMVFENLKDPINLAEKLSCPILWF